MFNNRGPIDTRKALTGKDGALFNDAGTMLATVETFQTQVNVTNSKYQPLGDAQEHEVFQAYGVTLTFTEIVIEDEGFIRELFDAFSTGVMPEWSFQGVVQGRNGSEQRMVYRDVVPSGTIDLQNLSVGDVIKRAWSLFVNSPPELQSLLRA
jgi:hypothetical protein